MRSVLERMARAGHPPLHTRTPQEARIAYQAGADVLEDATAAMRGGDPKPVLDRWAQAAAKGQPFCVAINEYPLYQLRNAAPQFAPLAE
eukprot:gene18034-23026_t